MKALWMVLASLGLQRAQARVQSAEGNRSLAGSWRLTEVATQNVPMTGGSAKLLGNLKRHKQSAAMWVVTACLACTKAKASA